MLGDVARPPGIEIHELLERAYMLEDAAIVSEDASKANIRRFLNRLLCVEVRGQETLFGVFSEALKRNIEAAKADGSFEDGMADLKGSSITLATQPQDLTLTLTLNLTLTLTPGSS